ncbi:MAG: carbohydrate ABC transporter permease [Scrofimicrobium sp.]
MKKQLGFWGVIARLLMWGALLTLVLIVLYPLIWMVIGSFKTNYEFLNDPFGFPQVMNWGNYGEAWERGIGRYLLNSIIVTIVSVVTTTLISAWAAFGLTKLVVPFGNVLLFLIVGGLMLAPTVALIPLLKILQALGINDTLFALIILYTAFRIPFTTFLIRSYMVDLPVEVDEAAVLDGCSPSQTFWRVTLPMSKPILISSVILQVLFAWNEYLFAFIFISDEATKTLPVGLADLSSRLTTDYPMVLAGMTMAALPMIILFFAGQRFFIQGLADGVGK